MNSQRETFSPLKSLAGFTLIEMVITIVLLGASSMILLPFFSSISHSPDPVMRARAVSLGQSIMDEIIAKKWDESTRNGGGPILTTETVAPPSADCNNGVKSACETDCDGGNRVACYKFRYDMNYSPDSATAAALLKDEGETRMLYDDVDDYDGLDALDVFTDQDGNTFNLPGYRREVDVSYVSSTLSDYNSAITPGANPTDSKLVVVTVTTPTGEVFNFTSVRCNL